jgi:hypothetical protein
MDQWHIDGCEFAPYYDRICINLVHFLFYYVYSKIGGTFLKGVSPSKMGPKDFYLLSYWWRNNNFDSFDSNLQFGSSTQLTQTWRCAKHAVSIILSVFCPCDYKLPVRATTNYCRNLIEEQAQNSSPLLKHRSWNKELPLRS